MVMDRVRNFKCMKTNFRNSMEATGKRLVKGLACLGILGVLCLGTLAEAQSQPPNLPAGVSDAIKLTRAGIAEEIILTQIRNQGTAYNLTADQVIYLSNQGVSQNVIKALFSGGKPGGVPAPANPAPVPLPSTPAPAVPGPGPVTGAPQTAVPGTTTSSPVSYEYFHDQLATSGAWIQDPILGLVWRPTIAATDPFWRPYLDGGHWVYTETGWFWQSDYAWGEIVFHYGRWHRGNAGWVWIPGYDWAPAWVTWRHSDGYVGWAPLPPSAVFRAGVGLEFNGRLAADVDFGLGVQAYAFVPYDRFWDRDIHRYILPHDRVEFVFQHSMIMNGYRVDRGRFVIEGIGRERLAGFTRHEIRVESPQFRDTRIQRHFESDRRGWH